MREIEFRGKDIKTGKWMYGGLREIWSSTNERYVICPGLRFDNDGFTDIDDVEVDSETVGQYTGLKDKNGVKIFEGDIVQLKTHYYGKEKIHKKLIIFEDEIENDSFGEPFTCGYCIPGSDWKVIGNEYDNPELLKESGNDLQ